MPSKKLTNRIDGAYQSNVLTNHQDYPFIISFKYKLENGYTFKELKKEDLKSFQAFLNKVSNMTISQVDDQYLRNPDKEDRYNNHQVQHYAVDKRFRIHGIFENNRFKVLRIDPKHAKHD